MNKNNSKIPGVIVSFLLASLYLGNAGRVFANSGEMSYTPTSFKMPIYSIVLGSTTSSAVTTTIYTCPGSTDSACAIDMAGSAASISAALAAGTAATAAVGTYNQVTVTTCATGAKSYTLQVQGSAVINSGTTYYTNTAAAAGTAVTTLGQGVYQSASSTNPLTTTQANQGYVTHIIGGCSKSYPLAAPVTFAASSSVTTSPSGTPSTTPVVSTGATTVSLYVTLRNAAMMIITGNSDTNLTQIGGGGMVSGLNCVVDSGTSAGNFSCVNLPVLVPFVGSNVPTKEVYAFWDNQNSQTCASTPGVAAAEITLLFDSTGAIFLGGFPNLIASSTSYTMGTSSPGVYPYYESSFSSPFGTLALTGSSTSSCPSAAVGAAACTLTGGANGKFTGGLTVTNFMRLPNSTSGATTGLTGTTTTDSSGTNYTFTTGQACYARVL